MCECKFLTGFRREHLNLIGKWFVLSVVFVVQNFMWNTITVQYNPLIEEEFDEHFKVTCEYGYDFWKTVSFPFLDVEWVNSIKFMLNPFIYRINYARWIIVIRVFMKIELKTKQQQLTKKSTQTIYAELRPEIPLYSHWARQNVSWKSGMVMALMAQKSLVQFALVIRSHWWFICAANMMDSILW